MTSPAEHVGPFVCGHGGLPLALARSALDRAAERRTDQRWLERAWSERTSRVLLVCQARTLVSGGDRPALVFVPPGTAGPEGERYLLGVDGEGVDGEGVDGEGVDGEGTAYFALALPQPPGLPEPAGGARVAGLREVGTLLSDRDAGLLVHAVALEQWHRFHGHCARCGVSTVAGAAGHLRRCPACGAEHYPRTDPAVIVCITDPDDRILLGRQERWPPRRYSIFAGFVEPGESLEQAVAREVAEEVGVHVTDVRYAASQPWPFPSSLMLGFTARSSGTRVRVDGTEISEACWYSRAELRAAVRARTLLLPSGVSIARRMIEDWYGELLPEDNHW